MHPSAIVTFSFFTTHPAPHSLAPDSKPLSGEEAAEAPAATPLRRYDPSDCFLKYHPLWEVATPREVIPEVGWENARGQRMKTGVYEGVLILWGSFLQVGTNPRNHNSHNNSFLFVDEFL